MKQLIVILVSILCLAACSSTKTTKVKEPKEEPVVIENDSLEYRIIILDLGFNTYLNTIARPKEFYTQQYYENKNLFYVNEWNIRNRDPLRWGDFYQSKIDYSPQVDYGLDVNYKLYNYFKFCEHKYGIRFF
ncbi:hypothetical protein KH5_06160 [Urechidicola sp. KH5]